MVKLIFDVITHLATFSESLELINLLIALRYTENKLYKNLIKMTNKKFIIIKKYFNKSALLHIGGYSSLLNLPFLKIKTNNINSLILKQSQQKYPIQWGIDSYKRVYISFRIIHPEKNSIVIETVFKRYLKFDLWAGKTQIIKIIPTTILTDSFKKDNLFAYNINMLINNRRNHQISLISNKQVFNPLINDFEYILSTNKIKLV